MDPREALLKATLTTSDVTAGLLPPEVARQFVVQIKEKTAFSNYTRQEFKQASSGSLDKLSTASRIIRRATENADDGYRVGASFGTVGYSTVKVRLPWEVTEDTFHENIEGEGLETKLVDQMTTQFGLDLEDLEINGDTTSADPFVSINNGLFKLLALAGGATHHVDGSLINGGAINIAHFFTILSALPNKYRNALAGRLKFFMSPATATGWWEALALRTGIAADALFLGEGGAARSPLGIDIVQVPSFPDGRIVLADPQNFIRVISWDIRKGKVTGSTDSEMLLLDKRLYVYFMKHDFIVEEYDAVVWADGITF